MMDAESKERARDYLAADIFSTTVRLGGDVAFERPPKETSDGRSPARPLCNCPSIYDGLRGNAARRRAFNRSAATGQ